VRSTDYSPRTVITLTPEQMNDTYAFHPPEYDNRVTNDTTRIFLLNPLRMLDPTGKIFINVPPAIVSYYSGPVAERYWSFIIPGCLRLHRIRTHGFSDRAPEICWTDNIRGGKLCIQGKHYCLVGFIYS